MPLELGLLQCLVAVALWALVHADLLSSQTVALQIGLLVVSLLAPQSPGRDEGVAWGCFLVPLLCAVCALLQADRSTQVYFVELADMAGVLSIATFWDGHLLVRALCIAIANPLRDRRVSFLVAGVYLTLMHRNSVRILATSLRLGEMMTVSHCIALMLLVVAMDHGKLVTSAFIIQAVLLVALAVTTTTLWASAVDSKFVGSARCYWLIVPVILVGLVLMDLKIPEGSLLWMADLAISSWTRVALTVYWTLLLAVAILLVSREDFFVRKLPNLDQRKYFHLLAILLLYPGVVLELEYTAVALAAAVAALLGLECLRIARAPPFASELQAFFGSFLDGKDRGLLIVTHLQLLLGCAAPVWMAYLIPSQRLAQIGLLTTGVGDAVASVVGSRRASPYKWPRSHKSYFGSVASLLSQILCYALTASLVDDGAIHASVLLGACFAVVLEAVTTQTDNLLVPLATFVFVVLAEHMSD
eukprot:m.247283 g.247283  ORF g.247283 m.247283 type:complete len:473 (-) comp54479_c0_seq38:97-1515(-)